MVESQPKVTEPVSPEEQRAAFDKQMTSQEKDEDDHRLVDIEQLKVPGTRLPHWSIAKKFHARWLEVKREAFEPSHRCSD